MPDKQAVWPDVLPCQYDGYAQKVMLNESGGELEGGDVVVIDSAAANVPDGKLVPCTTTTIPGHTLVCGVVQDGFPPTPDGAPVVVQIAGLHPAVKVNGTEETLTEGCLVGTHSVAKYAAPVEGKDKSIGVYVDSTYALAAATKKVFLTNPANLFPDAPVPGHG